MARVRVFLCTYRRPHLLRRALKSLLAQTYQDWICEVRNDASDDHEPARIVSDAADPRLHYVHHERKLGGVAVFNEVYSCTSEPYVALLEDDNWWQPNFISRMVEEMDRHPTITIGWSNQTIWQESPTGEWSDTGRTVNPVPVDLRPVLFRWPHPRQCFGALHANGSILFRTKPGRGFPTPDMDLGGTEAMRERSFPHPLLYIPEPLAVFSLTQTTARSKNVSIWGTYQVLITAAYLKHAGGTPESWCRLWADARAAKPRMTSTLLLASFQESRLLPRLRYSRPEDWLRFLLQSVRRPMVFLRLLFARQRAPEVWRFVDLHSAERARERSLDPEATAQCIPFSQSD
jgi:glycosyltransferase involved in cell wall biosynthesis